MEDPKDLMSGVQQLNLQQNDVVEEIHRISLAAYRIEAELIGVSYFPPLLESQEDIQQSPNGFYGVFVSHRLAGAIELEEGDVVRINRLVVAPEFFRCGIATKLLSYAKSRRKNLEVLTATANQPAVKLYQQMGFSIEHSFVLDKDIEVFMFEYSAAY